MKTSFVFSFRTVSFLTLPFLLGSNSFASTVSSPTFGLVVTNAPTGMTGVAATLILSDIASGKATANTSSVVTLSNSAGSVGSRLTTGDNYYLEVLSGPLEGERVDVDTAATKASGNTSVILKFGASTHSTLNSLAPGALSSSLVAVRPYSTLAKIAASFAPALVGNNNFNLADGVRVLTPSGLVFYYLRGDNLTWREPGKTTDLRGLIIPPDESLIVQIRSTGKTWTQAGLVRTTAFRKNLVAGLNSFSTGRPDDFTPTEIGAFVDPALPASVRWSGNDNVSAADSLRVFDSTISDFTSYSLHGDGHTWTSANSSTNVASTRILTSPNMIVIKRANADAAYVISPPSP